MKKILYLLVLPLLALGFSSCDDDEDRIPDVGVQAEISGGVLKDGAIYVVKGDTLTVDALKIVNKTNKEATLANVVYYWDYLPLGPSELAPFGIAIATDDVEVGKHLLTARMNILVVDYPINFGVIAYPVEVVASVTDMPAGPSSGTIEGQVSQKE